MKTQRDSQCKAKTESLMFVFDGGILQESEISAIQLSAGELSQFAFFRQDGLPEAMTKSLKERVLAAWQQYDHGQALYLEDQQII